MERQRGMLKIFFGYAAGVGKTYAMLEAARMEQQGGRDVVVGYVEPHARPDTMGLLEGLEQIPLMEIAYRGILLKEMDLDGALARKPELILVDELAHTNAKGCRHKKRWKDVQELLDAGIDVLTTVNVQHLESLHDIVAAITHVKVSERIPDRMFDEANRIELVDVEPGELLERLQAGKIYGTKQAKQASGHFFTVENLTALREIALRRTADQVNQGVVRQRHEGGQTYYTGEHILVCISPSPSNQKVIRMAARMAHAFHAQLTAVAVEPFESEGKVEEFHKQIEEHLTLAKQFGAAVVMLRGEDVAYQIADYARDNGVSKIVIGRTIRQTGMLGIFEGKASLIDRLIQIAPNMDVYVIPDGKGKAQKQSLFSVMISSSKFWVIFIWVIGVFVFLYEGFHSLILLGMLLCVAFISTLALRLKKQATIATEETKKMQALIAFGNQLRLATTQMERLQVYGKQVMRLLRRSVIIYDATEGRLKQGMTFSLQETMEKSPLEEESEYAVAGWVWKNNHKAGHTTNTLPGATGYYVPIQMEGVVFGVIGIEIQGDTPIPSKDKALFRVMTEELAAILNAHSFTDSL